MKNKNKSEGDRFLSRNMAMLIVIAFFKKNRVVLSLEEKDRKSIDQINNPKDRKEAREKRDRLIADALSQIDRMIRFGNLSSMDTGAKTLLATDAIKRLAEEQNRPKIKE
ncbi:MAG: hypothetical protein Q8Q37_02290 [bacterium]|nr:hypothetical protein [bacterium]